MSANLNDAQAEIGKLKEDVKTAIATGNEAVEHANKLADAAKSEKPKDALDAIKDSHQSLFQLQGKLNLLQAKYK